MNTEVKFSTQHIKNKDVGFIFEKILERIYSSARKNLLNSPIDQLSAKLGLEILNKVRIQYSSAIHLTFNHRIDPYFKTMQILDIASINSIIRSIYESILINNYIYMQSELFRKENNIIDKNITNDEIIEFKVILFEYDGSKQLPDLNRFSHPESRVHRDLKQIEKILTNNKVFKSLSVKNANNIKNKWKPKIEKLIEATDIDSAWGNDEYKLMSYYCHNAINAINTIAHFERYKNTFDNNAINCFLYSITAIYINDLKTYLDIEYSNLHRDEINLISEFSYIAKYGQYAFVQENSPV